MRTTIEIDRGLLEEAVRVTGALAAAACVPYAASTAA
ncbi:MAG TPA: type II toxin-antitoxin system VapB family antitoxin [Thermoanaerobaculia bacterium]|nr:type II toxin-antitoxin system VapB family antitoxin [Thermoanaerobaculia bacterium]